MADNSVYWTDQSGWYQQPGPPPPQASYQPSTHYSNQGPSMPNEHNNHTSTSPQNHIQSQTPSHPHQLPPQQQQQPQPPPPQHPPPPHSSQQQTQHHHQQMMSNGVSNGNHNMQSNIQCSQPGPLSQPMGQMSVYNPTQGSIIHHESMNSAPPPIHQVNNSTNYQMHHQNHAYQPPQQQPQQQQQNQPAGQVYVQSNHSYPNSMPAQAAPNSVHMQQPGQQQQQQPHSYPHQQYSPASYWNQGPMQSQSNYGPLPPNGSQGPPQTITTPPSAIADNSAGYHPIGAPMSGPPHQPPPPPQQQQAPPQQQPPPQLSSSMPYDNRGTNISNNYSTPYQQPQQSQGYYGPPDMQQPSEPPVNYDMSHQQQGWSNGYYQPSQSPYTGAMNSYPPPYNGSNPTAPNQSHQMASSVHGPPPMMQHQQPPHHHYSSNPAPSHSQPNHPPSHLPNQMHQQNPQQSHQWTQQNHNIPIIERNKAKDKKPVKPRAPKKQSNPNKPAGRRKRQPATDEPKHSGYALFFQIKQKELGSIDFAQNSKTISEQWARLTDAEKSTYVKEVSAKRIELLRKKASKQAQDLVVPGMTQEQ